MRCSGAPGARGAGSRVERHSIQLLYRPAGRRGVGPSPALLPSSTWNHAAQPWCRKLGKGCSQELEEEEGREATWLPGRRDRWLSQVHTPVSQLRQKIH